MNFKYFQFCVIVLLLNSLVASSQVVYEPTYHGVYSFLSRIAQRGIIEYDDIINPLPRTYIVQKLEELVNESSKLTKLERNELVFYLKEYKLERMLLDSNMVISERSYILKKGENDRFRFMAFQNKNFTINAQPIAGYSFSSLNQNITSHYWNGARIHGYIGKNFGFSFDFRDNTESGLQVDKNRDFSPLKGIIAVGTNNNVIAYNEFNGMLSYNWKWGVFSAGKDELTWGYGDGGKIVLSNKAPTFPLIRLDIRPTKWLRFNYVHGWLNSNLIDSTKIFYTGVGTPPQISFRQKFFVNHSLIFTASKKLSLALGESAIYSDELKFVYFVPILFYRAIDHYLGGTTQTNSISNSQFFLQLSSRNLLIKNTHFYFAWFIDEFSLSGTLLSGNRVRNQTAYTIGLSINNFPLKNLSILTEYTKVRPFTYSNYVSAQSYQSNNYNLGHWIGGNADQWNNKISYRIKRGWEINLQSQFVRKGKMGTGLEQQNENGTPFLDGGIVKLIKEYKFNTKYEIIHDLFFSAEMKNISLETPSITNPSENTISNNNIFSCSLNYGF
ncbi:capsule assembly protein Wzi [Arcicella aurantiaca]|uniref:Capsule assembly protein Wzi n=1 Tax=Arcicella aurantiaca TaxID=591202 RepID=A0A316DYT0_9BACT|nr:capsule assembly Wzi family protein [Arcicella aurantiaca]PWK22399.1 capsule assembly protein Wzi [Arcicella aurantiaca]